jgi:hypothetical protein
MIVLVDVHSDAELWEACWGPSWLQRLLVLNFVVDVAFVAVEALKVGWTSS